MLASLPMYDLPEVRPLTDAWWKGLAAALRRSGINDVPESLTRADDLGTVWRDPGLLFSQACGYPLTHGLASVVQPVATPIYEAPGCTGAHYSSAIVINADHQAHDLEDLRDGVCAVNARNSQSGYNCFRAKLAPFANGKPFFSRVIESGSHGSSLALVASGEADVCSTDCVTHALLARYKPQALAGTRILGYTEHAPAMPYVTRADADSDLVRRLRDGLMAALADPGLADTREALLLTGADVLPTVAYDAIVEMENGARAGGYAELC